MSKDQTNILFFLAAAGVAFYVYKNYLSPAASSTTSTATASNTGVGPTQAAAQAAQSSLPAIAQSNYVTSMLSGAGMGDDQPEGYDFSPEYGPLNGYETTIAMESRGLG